MDPATLLIDDRANTTGNTEKLNGQADAVGGLRVREALWSARQLAPSWDGGFGFVGRSAHTDNHPAWRAPGSDEASGKPDDFLASTSLAETDDLGAMPRRSRACNTEAWWR